MEHPGFTRSSNSFDHLLHTPDTFVRTVFSGMRGASAIVHTSPARGAAFAAYTVEFEPGGVLPGLPPQRFVYVLEGEIQAGAKNLAAGHFAYFPPNSRSTVTSKKAARAFVFEKPLLGKPTKRFTGDERAVKAAPLGGDDSGLSVRVLIPDEPIYDFAVNTMTYLPGASLPMVEIHVMEHGLLMLEGEGIYRLGDRWYPVKAGDFIWMGPYCPQWFCAVGRKPAKYLIYKDWNRHPLEAL